MSANSGPNTPAHSALKPTLSHPVTSLSGQTNPPEDPRGSSLGRNVPPPSDMSGYRLQHRPPSQVTEEMSDTDTDSGDNTASKVASPPALLPPPPANQRLSPWKEFGKTRGHARSASHGGGIFTRTNSNRERQREESGTLPPTSTSDLSAADNFKRPLPSALKRPGHRRVFSECTKINPEDTAIPGHMKGHTKAVSKTDFILPHDHVDRERRSSLMTASKGAGLQGNGRGGHRRGHSRGDSLGQFFRGHSRQASRTDSIYTLRQTTPNVMNKIRFWQKGSDPPQVERKCRKVVPRHLVPSDSRVRTAAFLGLSQLTFSFSGSRSAKQPVPEQSH